MVVGGKSWNQRPGWTEVPVCSFPEGKKLQDLVVGLIPLNVRRGIQDQPGSGILGHEGQGPFHPSSPGPSPMFLEYRFFAVMGDGMKIQVNDPTVIQTQRIGFLDEGLLETKQMDFVQGIGIGGQGRTFGQDIEAGEQTQAGIEGVIAHMGITLGAQELQSQKGQQDDGRDHLGPRKSRLHDQIPNLEFLQERSKEEDPGRFTIQPLAFQMPDGNPFRLQRDLSPRTVRPILRPIRRGSLEKPSSAKTRFTVLTEISTPSSVKSRVISLIEVVFSPGTDLLADLRRHPIAGGRPFGDRLGEVDLPQKIDVGGDGHTWGIAEPIGYRLGRDDQPRRNVGPHSVFASHEWDG